MMLPDKLTKPLILIADMFAIAGGTWGALIDKEGFERTFILIAIGIYILARALKVLAQSYEHYARARYRLSQGEEILAETIKKYMDKEIIKIND